MKYTDLPMKVAEYRASLSGTDPHYGKGEVEDFANRLRDRWNQAFEWEQGKDDLDGYWMGSSAFDHWHTNIPRKPPTCDLQVSHYLFFHRAQKGNLVVTLTPSIGTSLIMHNENKITEVRQKEVNAIAKEMKSAVKENHTISDVLLAWAEDARIVSERKCGNILLAAYQLGKEQGRNDVLSTQQKAVNHDN